MKINKYNILLFTFITVILCLKQYYQTTLITVFSKKTTINIFCSLFLFLFLSFKSFKSFKFKSNKKQTKPNKMACAASSSSGPAGACVSISVKPTPGLSNEEFMARNPEISYGFDGITQKGKRVIFVGVVPETNDTRNCGHFLQTEFGCRLCGERGSFLARCFGPKGYILKDHADVGKFFGGKIPEKWTLQLLTEMVQMVGGFPHIFTQKSDLTKKDRELIGKAFSQFSQLIYQMLEKMDKDDIQALKEGIPVFLSALSQVTYAEGILKEPTLWLKAILDDIPICFSELPEIQKMKLIGEAILSGNIVPGSNNSAALLYYHAVVGNVLDMLKVARDSNALKKLMADRVVPGKYQHRTAEPSPQSVAISNAHFENMEQTLLTWLELVKDHGAILVKGAEKKITAAFALEWLGKKTAGKGVSKYSVGGPRESDAVSAFKRYPTIGGLIALLRSGEAYSLQVDGSLQTTAYLAKYEGVPEDTFIHPFLWCFLNGRTSFFQGFVEIACLQEIKFDRFNNIFFIPKNAGQTRISNPIRESIGIAEFLHTSIRRTHGTTFAELGRMVPITYPDTDDIGIAIGISVEMLRTKPLVVKINGESSPITIRS